MSCFLGIGFGPIQTGIFLAGATGGGFDRMVIAEANQALVDAVRANNGTAIINIAGKDGISQLTLTDIEIYNPCVEDDLVQLRDAAGSATEIATALPSVSVYNQVAPWLRDGFAQDPDLQRFVYTAENNNFAAEVLHGEIWQEFPNVHYLNTVIGKMSKVVAIPEDNVAELCPGAGVAHLVEEFNKILISSAPGIDQRQVQGLIPKADILPFEEAKLYGHNAIHFFLAWYARKAKLEHISDLNSQTRIMAMAREAFVNETGKALCHKWQGLDELFTREGFEAHADDLLARMLNPYLKDTVDRVLRDIPRKLAWNDRILGTIRMCFEQQVIPRYFMQLASECFEEVGDDSYDFIQSNVLDQAV